MEVSGRIGTSDSFISCRPCQDDGDTVQAEGYCENCNQFICLSCIKAHRKLPMAKNHVIKSKYEMPKSPAVQSDPCTELCDVHKNEVVKFYCEEHDSMGCGDCMVLDHTSCKVQLVSDVSCNYDDSDELVCIKHRIDQLKKNIDSCKSEIELSLKTADEIKTSIINEIKQFRKEMDAYLDKVTKDLMQKVETLSSDDVSRQQKLHGQCKATNEDIDKMKRKLEQCKDNVNDLFVSSKRIQNKLQKCQDINEDISAKSQIHKLKFSPDENFTKLKERNKHLGNLDSQVEKFSGHCKKNIIDMKAHFVQKFNLKGKQESKCCIRGLTMVSETEILCADAENMSLKLFNHKEGIITSTLKMSSPPSDVTTINTSSAATTFNDEDKVVFLNTRNGLTISHSIKVREGCVGIDHRYGIMAVTFFNPSAVQVIDMEGHVLHEVKDTSILNSPLRVCLSNDTEGMFVSDGDNAAVHEFTIQGHLINTFKSDNMKSPVGIINTICGSVVVCDLDSNKVGIIVPGAKGLFPFYFNKTLKPCFILIDEEQRKMFICEYYESEDVNYIQMFDLK